MKIRVTIYSFFFLLYSILFFLPSYFSNGFTGLLSNVFFFFGMCFLLLKRYRPSKFMILATLYLAFIIVMSFINKTDRADYHLVVSNAKMLVFLAVTEWSVRKDTSRAVNTLFGVLLVYSLMDFASIVLFPNGLYFRETVWNEWSTSKYAQWLFGNKNNRAYWYLNLLLLAGWKMTIKRGYFSDFIMVMLLVMSMAAMLLVDSATSTIVIAVAAVGIWLGMLSKKDSMLRINTKLIYPAYVVLELLWVTGSVTFLRPIIEGLLGRTMSFTNRTNIWTRAIYYIFQKPMFGWGLLGDKATELLGSKAYVNVHNQLLDVLWQGGLFGLVIFTLIMLLITKCIGRISNNRKNIFLVFMFAAILLEMLAETIMGVDATWVYLLLCLQFSNYIVDQESHDSAGGRQCKRIS